jgi:putative oxidoreductase
MWRENKLRTFVLHSKTLFLVRFFLGVIFLVSSFGKILDPKSFAENLVAYQLIPSPQFVKVLAVTLPWVEWFCGIFLILGVFVRSVAILSSGLFLSFIGAMIFVLSRGLQIQCGCFGAPGEMVGLFSLLRDFFFLALSSFLMFSSPDAYSLQHVLVRRRGSESKGDN